MLGVIIVEVVAIFAIVMGILIMCKKSLLAHSCHRNSVKAKNETNLARGVGFGIIVIGIGAFILGALMLPTVLVKNKLFLWIGFAAFAVFFAVGIIIAFHTTKKYTR